MDMAVLFSSLMGLFLLIGVGFFAVRAGLLPAEASKPLSTLLMKITLPATVLTSLLQPFDPSFLPLPRPPPPAGGGRLLAPAAPAVALRPGTVAATLCSPSPPHQAPPGEEIEIWSPRLR